MTPAEIGVAAAAVAAAAGAFGYVIRARADFQQSVAVEHATERDDVKQLLDLKDEMIGALREQNEDLRRREGVMDADIADLKRRLGVVEHEYRTLLQKAVELGICANAPGCVNYQPPADRRGEPYRQTAN